MHMEKLIVASNNKNKLREFAAIMGGRFEIVSMRDAGVDADIEENGTTFEENALIKAEYVAKVTGCAAIADDSGLEVDALGGAPGVWSARWAGVHGADDANNEKLMREMADVPEGKRTARFHSSVVLAYADGSSLVGEGDCEGRIGYDPVGTNGFGYDPLFLPDDTPGRTMAQLELAEKNTISHRYHALIDLSAKLTRG